MPWPYTVVGTVDAADEIPLDLAARTAVLVQPADHPTWIAFDCPRHRNQRIMLNLSTGRRPYWTIHDRVRLTLHPSIEATHNGSRCHFWLRRGHLKWAKLIRLNDGGRGNERY